VSRNGIWVRDNLTLKQEQKPEPEQEATSDRVFDFEKEPEKLNELVNEAMKDIQDEIDLQSLVNNAMVECQEIHQEMERQKELPRLAEHKRQKPDKGWLFSR